jgi:hypothetical protein
MEYEKLTPEQIKKLKSIERRMKVCNQEIWDMGFNVYLANDMVNIMDGDSHSGIGEQPQYQNVRHSFTLKGWTGGDW